MICVTLRGWIKSAATYFISYKVHASGTVYTNRKLLQKNMQMSFRGDTNYINHAKYGTYAIYIKCPRASRFISHTYLYSRHDLSNTYGQFLNAHSVLNHIIIIFLVGYCVLYTIYSIILRNHPCPCVRMRVHGKYSLVHETILNPSYSSGVLCAIHHLVLVSGS